MRFLEFERVAVMLLPLYFFVRYLITVRPRRRAFENWLLLGSHLAWFGILALGASSIVFGLDWAGRTLVQGLVYAVIFIVLGSYVVWLEWVLHQRTKVDVPLAEEEL
jgi:hypothetical protein